MAQQQIFYLCRKAIPKVHGLGADKAVPQDVDSIKSACSALRLLVRELCLEPPPPESLTVMSEVLKELHPEIPYGDDPMLLVRDIADVVITLDRLVDNRHRSDSEKVLIAQLFCTRLSEEADLAIHA